MASGKPFVYFGQTGGARIPDILGSEGFAEVGGAPPTLGTPPTRIPHVDRHRRRLVRRVVVHRALISDLTIQVRGTCMAVTSPRVFAVATGEQVELRGAGRRRRARPRTGQIDRVDSRRRGLRRWSAASSPTCRPTPGPPPAGGSSTRRARARPGPRRAGAGAPPAAYDMRRVLARLDRRRHVLRAAARHGPRPDHRLGPHRRLAGGDRRQPTRCSGRRARPRRLRQGHPAAGAVRRLPASRSCSCRTCPASSSAARSSTAGSSTGRSASTRRCRLLPRRRR